MLEILKIAIDILSLAAILFFIYRFAVKRRALKLAMGVVLFLLVMLIVDAAELTALGFVFGDFRQLGVIAILIIFQPELRSALEKIGGTTYEGIQNINHAVEKPAEANSHKIIDAIASAAQAVLNVISAQLMPLFLSAVSILSVSDSSFMTTTGMNFSIFSSINR